LLPPNRSTSHDIKDSTDASTIQIPLQLRNERFRFILVRKGRKEAIEKDWQTTANYAYNDPKLTKHLRNGGNYGVMPRTGALIFDADDLPYLSPVIQSLLPTFTVMTKNGEHRYYQFEGDETPNKIPLYKLENKKEHVGEVFLPNCPAYVVGPSCKHPDGGRYTIGIDSELTIITKFEAEELIFSKLHSSKTAQRIKSTLKGDIPENFSPHRNLLTEQLNLRIDDLVRPINAITRNGEYQGEHPIHGSSTGMNFTVNPAKNFWYCFRCNAGGDPIAWIAVSEGIIGCSEAGSPLTQEDFIKVKDVLRNKYGLGQELNELDRDRRDKRTHSLPHIKESEIPAQKPVESRRMTCNLPESNFIQKYVNAYKNVSDAYIEYHYASALAILSAMANRGAVMRFAQTTVYPNVWQICLGASTTSRKSSSVKKARKYIDNTIPAQVLACSFSPEALIRVASTNPHLVHVLDEAGALFSSLQKPYMREATDILCDFYDNGRHKRVTIGNNKGGGMSEHEAKNVYLTQLLALTPESFQRHTDEYMMTEGWLCRFIYYSPQYSKPRKGLTYDDINLAGVEAELSVRVLDIYRMFAGKNIEFRFTAEGLEYHQKWEAELELLYPKGIKSSLAGRLSIVAIKLAMLFKIGSDELWKRASAAGFEIPPDEMIIVDLDYIREACRLVSEYFIPTAFEVANLIIQEQDNLQVKILNYLKGVEMGHIVSVSEIVRYTHRTIRDTEDALDALALSGEIEMFVVDPGDKNNNDKKKNKRMVRLSNPET
jgi:hypothetical protein